MRAGISIVVNAAIITLTTSDSTSLKVPVFTESKYTAMPVNEKTGAASPILPNDAPINPINENEKQAQAIKSDFVVDDTWS